MPVLSTHCIDLLHRNGPRCAMSARGHDGHETSVESMCRARQTPRKRTACPALQSLGSRRRIWTVIHDHRQACVEARGNACPMPRIAIPPSAPQSTEVNHKPMGRSTGFELALVVTRTSEMGYLTLDKTKGARKAGDRSDFPKSHATTLISHAPASVPLTKATK